jgi:DNA-binding XRE family transcriptional regulator
MKNGDEKPDYPKDSAEIQRIMRFAGCWNDMDDDEFEEFLQEIYDRRSAFRDRMEELQDIRDFDETLARIREGKEEAIPAEFVYRMVRGENSIKVWREYREWTEKALAEAVGIDESHLAQIEAGEIDPSAKTVKRIAEALEVDVDDLI